MDGPEMTRTTPSSLPSALMGTSGMSLARMGWGQFAVRHRHGEMKSCVSHAVMNQLAADAAERTQKSKKDAPTD